MYNNSPKVDKLMGYLGTKYVAAMDCELLRKLDFRGWILLVK
jgi:hypothetical protein